jgi:hypothetical protein
MLVTTDLSIHNSSLLLGNLLLSARRLASSACRSTILSSIVGWILLMSVSSRRYIEVTIIGCDVVVVARVIVALSSGSLCFAVIRLSATAAMGRCLLSTGTRASAS